jgi:hypothetical protein
LAQEGKGQVVEDWAWTFAHQLHLKGWLEARTETNGDTSYWWTQQAKNALTIDELVDVSGRSN